MKTYTENMLGGLEMQAGSARHESCTESDSENGAMHVSYQKPGRANKLELLMKWFVTSFAKLFQSKHRRASAWKQSELSPFIRAAKKHPLKNSKNI